MTETTCPTCGEPGGDHFMGMCDQCSAKHQDRLARNRSLLVKHGQERSDFGRAIGAGRADKRHA